MEIQTHIHIRHTCRALHNHLSSGVCLLQAVKQDLSEVFAVYLSFATELEEQSKQLLEKVEQAGRSLNGHRGDEVESEYPERVGSHSIT